MTADPDEWVPAYRTLKWLTRWDSPEFDALVHATAHHWWAAAFNTHTHTHLLGLRP